MEMLNTCWIEDIYLILIAHKNKTVTTEQAKKHLAVKHRLFKEHRKTSMTDDELWNYCVKHEQEIIDKFENMPV
jgi:hypothetical protein